MKSKKVKGLVLVDVETVGGRRVEVEQTRLFGEDHGAEAEQVGQSPVNDAPRLAVVATGSSALLHHRNVTKENNPMNVRPARDFHRA